MKQTIGFTLSVLLAILLLGEAFRAFHAAGIATIIAGVVLATWRREKGV